LLADSTAVVTGGSRGIGFCVASAFSQAGARVALVARGAEALAEAADAIGGHAIAADVSDPAAVQELAERVTALFDGAAPDLLVNAAGAFELAPLTETDPLSFERQNAVNLRAPFLLIHAFLPAMLARGSGHVVTFGSVAGRHAFPHNGAYSASKFGVRGLHAVLDMELRGTGVRSTLVEPAATATPLWDAIDRGRHPDLPPEESMMRPEAVADAVLYAVTRPPEVDIRNLILERS
jgi:NADP-dependent 3-hydroxy acid dehydrogenase YdfG